MALEPALRAASTSRVSSPMQATRFSGTPAALAAALNLAALPNTAAPQSKRQTRAALAGPSTLRTVSSPLELTMASGMPAALRRSNRMSTPSNIGIWPAACELSERMWAPMAGSRHRGTPR